MSFLEYILDKPYRIDKASVVHFRSKQAGSFSFYTILKSGRLLRRSISSTVIMLRN